MPFCTPPPHYKQLGYNKAENGSDPGVLWWGAWPVQAWVINVSTAINSLRQPLKSVEQCTFSASHF